MTDIVDRLRNRVHDAPLPTERLLDEAADEIERLRETLKEIAEVDTDSRGNTCTGARIAIRALGQPT
jgi:hypothetical protein